MMDDQTKLLQQASWIVSKPLKQENLTKFNNNITRCQNACNCDGTVTTEVWSMCLDICLAAQKMLDAKNTLDDFLDLQEK